MVGNRDQIGILKGEIQTPEKTTETLTAHFHHQSHTERDWDMQSKMDSCKYSNKKKKKTDWNTHSKLDFNAYSSG